VKSDAIIEERGGLLIKPSIYKGISTQKFMKRSVQKKEGGLPRKWKGDTE
jgi:hypothetical protein